MPRTSHSRGDLRFAIAFLWLCILAMLWPVMSGWWAKHPGDDWSTTRGQVVSIECRKRGRHFADQTEWRYRYEVKGVQHSASYPYDFCDPDSLFRSRMRHAGGPIQVFYDPQAPSRSVLEARPAFPWHELIFPVIGIGVTLVFTRLNHKQVATRKARR